ncbi:cell division protein FtsX [Dethiosulfatibacter aminovorans DSM 17477]|uniref:Cell division protein FtsX n=1 Tax=Dethiosulfatibacter aminovorans DSM 17477 TaxID=1121476 RepID=A0A1M6DN58_9FIRM|nr:permease-like cell division protein FtsX [Dethiosulfatibacter aminovorans]SHI74549.1 cell division protein FtsX [Dethiosulfatibacter aminovorans DSM 17477]
MSIRILKHTFRQGFQGIFRNRTMSIASVGSITAVLVILGLVLMLILNVNALSLSTKEKFDEIYVYLDDNISNDRIREIGEEINDIEGTMTTVFQSKEYALENMKEDFGDDAYLLDGLANNPLPNTYVVQLKDVSYSKSVVNKIEKTDGIEEVRYYNDLVEKLVNMAEFIKTSGMVLIVILLLVSVFIIQNTIKITVASRKREIELMQYIGASNGFVRGPFLLEGIILGLLGAILSIIIVLNGYDYMVSLANEKFFAMLSVNLIPANLISFDLLIIFITIGVGIGILGSIVSLKKFLSV